MLRSTLGRPRHEQGEQVGVELLLGGLPAQVPPVPHLRHLLPLLLWPGGRPHQGQ